MRFGIKTNVEKPHPLIPLLIGEGDQGEKIYMDCLFCKFISGEIKKDFVYEDADIVVFPDIRPIKPVHLLIVPKKHISDFTALEDDKLLGRVRHVIQQMVKNQEIENSGYRIVVNAGGAQAIDHLHFHLTGPWGKAADL